jgi:MFS family permease
VIPTDARGAHMQQAEANNQPWPSGGKAWYAVSILVVAFIFSFIDRIIIALLVEPIKQDLGITDVGIGLLQGIVFTIFYVAVGIPIGRWADRYSRRHIITIGIFLWSIMTAACGLARSFVGLFLARVGVGVGQAALSPAAYSMIADYFPKEKLGRALGVYQAGAFFGAGIAFLVGGLVIRLATGAEDLVLPVLGTVRPWQIVFFVVGLPGILVAFLMLTVEEPARRGRIVGHDGGIPLKDLLGFVRRHRRFFLGHFCGFSLLAIPITTILTWSPVYFGRVLGYSPPEAGLTLGLILILLSPAGVYFGGWLTDALRKRGVVDGPLRVGIGAALLLLPLSFLATIGSSSTMAVIVFCPFIFCASISMGVAPATLQMVVPNEMRAQISATWMLVMNILTALIGPTGVGLITEYIFGDGQSVGYSLALVNCVSVPLAALMLWSGLKPFRAIVSDQAAAG